MIALVTGASSGIGRDMARYLNKLGYNVIITARDEEKLQELKEELDNTNKRNNLENEENSLKSNGNGNNFKNENNNPFIDIFIADLAIEEDCIKLHKYVKEKYKNIDILINNAGFGLFGSFLETDLQTEINMIDVNIKAVHILTKLFVQDMVKADKGTILNVSSVAGFMPGPLMITYYGTKNYVFRMSEALREELKRKKSNVKISVLCPGPVNTNFNNVAKVKFNLHEASSEYVAKFAIDKLLKHKFLIIPGGTIKMARFFSKITPDNILAKVCYNMQKKKRNIINKASFLIISKWKQHFQKKEMRFYC